MGKVNESNMKLAQNLLNLRKDQNLSQEDFAQRIGVSRQAVSRWEMGISTPSAQTLLQISSEFGISLDSIFGGTTDTSSSSVSSPHQHTKLNTLSILIILIGFIGLITLPFLAEIKQAREMELFKSAYEHSYHYITEFPLCILLIISLLLLACGLYFLIKNPLTKNKSFSH